jgi:hypothetical protein
LKAVLGGVEWGAVVQVNYTWAGSGKRFIFFLFLVQKKKTFVR